MQLLEVAELKRSDSIHMEAQHPFFTDHDYNFEIKIPSRAQNISDPVLSKKKAAKPFTECIVDLKRICRFCLNECDAADTVRIAWDVWEHSKLTQLYEEITNVEVRNSLSFVKCFIHSFPLTTF